MMAMTTSNSMSVKPCLFIIVSPFFSFGISTARRVHSSSLVAALSAAIQSQLEQKLGPEQLGD